MKDKNIRHSTDSLTQDNFEEATSRQYWALRCATGIDYRQQKLSKEVAGEMIKEANEKNNYNRSENLSITTFLSTKESIEKLKNAICNEIELKSILVSTDINGKEIEGAKKYIFVGAGCGFSWIEYDKRNKKITTIITKANQIKDDIDKLVVKQMDKNVVEYLSNIGSPIQAIQYQSEAYNNAYNGLVVNYICNQLKIEKEKIWVNSRLD
jgi:hypothetical protein